jgi:peptide/nickel transport system permease protein
MENTMVRYLLGRIFGLLTVFLLVSVVAFLLMHSIPGGPFDEGQMPLPPAAKENIRRKYGLDKPIYVQYFNYMSNAIRGDFGYSFQHPDETVIQVIQRTWPTSIALGGITVITGLGFGVFLGIVAAVRQNSWVDYVVTLFATLGLTVPNFVISFWLIMLFVIWMKALPIGGWPESWATIWSGDWKYLVMPVIALSLTPMGIAARYTRASLVDVLTSDYIRTARSKGLSEQITIWRHALKNALIPILTVLGPQVPHLITGTIFIETVFRVNGLGKYFVTSVVQRDYPLLMALMLLIAFLWGLVYLITDLLYVLIDPRIKLA